MAAWGEKGDFEDEMPFEEGARRDFGRALFHVPKASRIEVTACTSLGDIGSLILLILWKSFMRLHKWKTNVSAMEVLDVGTSSGLGTRQAPDRSFESYTVCHQDEGTSQ